MFQKAQRWGIESLLKEIMAKNFLNVGRDLDMQVNEANPII